MTFSNWFDSGIERNEDDSLDVFWIEEMGEQW